MGSVHGASARGGRRRAVPVPQLLAKVANLTVWQGQRERSSRKRGQGRRAEASLLRRVRLPRFCTQAFVAHRMVVFGTW